MRTKFLAIGALVGLASFASADVVLDQISTTEADHLNFNISTNFLDAANDPFDTVTVDDFTVNASQLLVFNVEAVMALANTAGALADTAWSNVANFRVEVYSSQAAAGAGATGDVASQLVAAGGASFTNLGWAGTNSSTRHWVFPVNIILPSAGTYWIGVEGEITGGGDFKQVFVSSNALNPGNQNSTYGNSAGGFGLTDGWLQIAEDSMYKVEAQPVPEPATMIVLGAGAALVAARRRRKRTA